MTDEVHAVGAGWLGGLYRWLKRTSPLNALRSVDGHEHRAATDESACPRCGRPRSVRTTAAELCAACLLDMALDVPDAPDEEGLDADESLPFEIVTILAQDAEAVTYLARGFVSSSHVAVKILAAPDLPAMLSRIHAWKPRLERVRHAGISRFVDAGGAGPGRVYLATEYVAGSSLAYLLRHRTLTPPDRMAIARQLADALTAIRAQGLAHMRLDTSRIKVATSGGVRATILGLGASVIVGDLQPQPDLDTAALTDVCRELGVALP